jgi:hypothetical protein
MFAFITLFSRCLRLAMHVMSVFESSVVAVFGPQAVVVVSPLQGTGLLQKAAGGGATDLGGSAGRAGFRGSRSTNS